MGSQVAEPGSPAEDTSAGDATTRQSPGRPWLVQVSTGLASFAAGAAVNDISATVGYHGLAGAVALLAVITTATWIKGLNPRARLRRRASWLYLAPAAVAAAIAACTAGATTSILTTAAAIFTIGALLIAKELEFAASLLAGAAAIAGGAAVIAGGAAAIADSKTLLGAAAIAVGAAAIAVGAAAIADSKILLGAATIAVGAALIAFGTVMIGPRSIMAKAQQAADWATKAPQSVQAPSAQPRPGREEVHDAEQAVSGPDLIGPLTPASPADPGSTHSAN